MKKKHLTPMCLHCLCPHLDNNLVLLVICGVGALVVVVIIGVVMKYKLKRDSGKSSVVCDIRQHMNQGESNEWNTACLPLKYKVLADSQLA